MLYDAVSCALPLCLVGVVYPHTPPPTLYPYPRPMYTPCMYVHTICTHAYYMYVLYTYDIRIHDIHMYYTMHVLHIHVYDIRIHDIHIRIHTLHYVYTHVLCDDVSHVHGTPIGEGWLGDGWSGLVCRWRVRDGWSRFDRAAICSASRAGAQLRRTARNSQLHAIRSCVTEYQGVSDTV